MTIQNAGKPIVFVEEKLLETRGCYAVGVAKSEARDRRTLCAELSEMVICVFERRDAPLAK